MRLITLNLWGGKLFDRLINFINLNSSETDIFCFQDVLFGPRAEYSPIQKARINLFEEIKKILPEFKAFVYRDPEESYVYGEFLPLDVGCGQVIFVRNNILILGDGGFRSHSESSYHKGGDMVSGRCQWVKIKHINDEEITVLNVHGLWQRNSQKRDTTERIEQSQKIKIFLESQSGKKILCGDFNITNDGKSIAILEDGMNNLVKKYGVRSTRSSYYPKEEKFADYILASSDVEVLDFKVLSDEVSDHLPLVFDFR